MSLYDLKSLISKEDFADAHEPLNDGVKEVPNAETVASGVKTQDTGTDITSAGEATTIPPKEDEVEETTFTEVKESAEKSDTDTQPKTEATTTTDDTENDGKGDEASDEVLEHESEKDTKSELKKTEETTTALEQYSERARRFDIIGYPKREREKLVKAIGFIARRSGTELGTVISAESIGHAAEVGRQRVAVLERQLQLHGKRTVAKEDFDAVVEAEVTEAPTAHGAPPLPEAAAAELTAVETDPLDVPLLEIERVQETIDTLQQGQVAIEQYVKIIKANPKMSKQAAAVLHAGLEHIDRVCGLKARSTGLESYVTTPRAAMEEADVSEKSLSSRASEIGAKILKWIKVLLEKIKGAWENYQNNLDRLEGQLTDLSGSKFQTEGELTLQPVPATLFLNGDFVGDSVTQEEKELYRKLDRYFGTIKGTVTTKACARLKGSDVADIEQTFEMFPVKDELLADLPGSDVHVVDGKLKLIPSDQTVPTSHTVDFGDIQPKKQLNEMAHLLKLLRGIDIVSYMQQSSDKVTKAIVNYRKGDGAELSEEDFQKVQSLLLDATVNRFDAPSFFDILKHVGKIFKARYGLYQGMVAK